jgi:hypothetical protein
MINMGMMAKNNNLLAVLLIHVGMGWGMGRREVVDLGLKPCALMLKEELHEAFEVSQELGLAFVRVPGPEAMNMKTQATHST